MAQACSCRNGCNRPVETVLPVEALMRPVRCKVACWFVTDGAVNRHALSLQKSGGDWLRPVYYREEWVARRVFRDRSTLWFAGGG
jgi:hypothetical protein